MCVHVFFFFCFFFCFFCRERVLGGYIARIIIKAVLQIRRDYRDNLELIFHMFTKTYVDWLVVLGLTAL